MAITAGFGFLRILTSYKKLSMLAEKENYGSLGGILKKELVCTNLDNIKCIAKQLMHGYSVIDSCHQEHLLAAFSPLDREC